MNCLFTAFASLASVLRSCPAVLCCHKIRTRTSTGRNVCCICRRVPAASCAATSAGLPLQGKNMEQDDSLSPRGRRNLSSTSPSTSATRPIKRARTQASAWRPFQSLFGRTLQLPAAAQGTETTQQEPPQLQTNETTKDEKQRKNRPGYNTYLKVLLDNSTLSELHQTTQELKEAVQEFTSLLSEENNQEATIKFADGIEIDLFNDAPNSVEEQERMLSVADSNENTTTRIENPASADEEEESRALATNCAVTNDETERGISHSSPPPVEMDPATGDSQNDEVKTVKKQPRRHLHVQPRSLNTLHLTLFFGGEVICNDLTAEELQAWHNSVKNRLRVSNFCTAGSNKAITRAASTDKDDHKVNNNDSASDLWFRISHLRTFPPRRNYLVVAVLEASPAWHALHDDLRTLASTSSCEALQEITKHSKELWTPHITLANLRGGNGREKIELQRLLKEFSNRLHEEKRDVLVAQGIGLGGPLPTQIDLDWNFDYRNVSTTEEES